MKKAVGGNMIIFEIEVGLNKENEEEVNSLRQSLRSQALAEKFASLYANKAICFPAEYQPGRMTILCGVKPDFLRSESIESVVKKYLEMIETEGSISSVREITSNLCEDRIREAHRSSCIESGCEAEASLMGDDDSDHRLKIKEEFIIEDYTYDQATNKAREIALGQPLTDEIDRIFRTPVDNKIWGHPAHYAVVSGSKTIREESIRLLVSSAHHCDRLLSGRIFSVKNLWDMPPGAFPHLKEVFDRARGGTLLITGMKDLDDEDAEYLKAEADEQARIIDSLFQNIIEYRHRVLTILSFSHAEEEMLHRFLSRLAGRARVLTLREQELSGRERATYLRIKAKKSGVEEQAKSLLCTFKGCVMTANELDLAFDRWFDRYLIEHQFTAYQSVCNEPEAEAEKPGKSAQVKLDEMIGLQEVKKVVRQAVDFFKVQQMLKSAGQLVMKPTMHMVFTGNPGTAKTTVARLLASIMKESGLLSVGNLYEVGRADLVGKYVGWTAKLVRQKLSEARGSVLFIDEAYSLLDDREGCFGDEAISTLVQEMENRRDDTIVILAGYTGKMEGLLERNPGLRSRIAFHLVFPDYSPEELLEIMKLMSTQIGLTLSPDAEEAAAKILSTAFKTRDFGNGRFVRNMLEKAMMHRASTLFESGRNVPDSKTCLMLTASDFENIEILPAREVKAIGFRLES
jgi:AAA+ superfamily predicted ATPase